MNNQPEQILHNIFLAGFFRFHSIYQNFDMAYDNAHLIAKPENRRLPGK